MLQALALEMSASLHNRNDFLGTCVSMASIEGQNSSVHLVDETSIERDAIQKTNVVSTTRWLNCCQPVVGEHVLEPPLVCIA